MSMAAQAHARRKYGLEEEVGGESVLDIMHGRSRHRHRLSHPCNAVTEHVGFSPTRKALLAPSAKRREVFGESHEG